MSTLADALLRQIQQPQNTGYMNAFNQGQQQAYGRGLSGALASGAPREEVLSKLAYVDPKLAGQEMGVFTSGQARETDAQRQAKMLNEAGPIRTKAIELANKIRSSLGQEGYDATEDFNALELLKDEFYTKSNGKKLDDRVFDLIEEDRRQGKYNIDQAKEGRSKSEFTQKTIDGFQKDWASAIDVLKNTPRIRTFANQAKKGSQVGFQNLLKAVSRMGSNEALSDSERDALKSGNIVDQLQSMFNRLAGTGVDASPKDVQSLLRLVDEMMPALQNQMKTAFDGSKQYIMQDAGLNENQARGRVFAGIPTKWAPVFGSVSGFKNEEEGDSGVTAKEKRQIEFLVATQKLSYEDALKKVKGL